MYENIFILILESECRNVEEQYVKKLKTSI